MEANKIGVTADGAGKLPNKKDGVLIDGSAASNQIQGGNIISGNDANGVHISGSATSSNIVEGNKIGTNDSDAIGIGNKESGVRIDTGATSNEIRGGNVISGNVENGVRILNAGTNANVVSGNLVGTKSDHTNALANGQVGILIEGAHQDDKVQEPECHPRQHLERRENRGFQYDRQPHLEELHRHG